MNTSSTKETRKLIARPPIVVVMGHVDHGKSTLLDFIRKANVVAGEAGGITQHIGAYEVTTAAGRRITFIDTPGHEAFKGMRSRGATTADVAILVVAANDGVKAQTVEALGAIKKAGIPFVVAINKIDLENANPERAKLELAEKEVYVEGYGGDVPFALISAKKGTGVPELLDTVLLVADMAELTGDPSVPGSGIVVESHLDGKSGASATIVLQNGSIKKPCFLVAEGAWASVRSMQGSDGTQLTEASFSSPLLVSGWNTTPAVGATFTTYASKREAEEACAKQKQSGGECRFADEDERVVLPVLIKADVAGTLEAILGKLAGLDHEKLRLKIVSSGVGPVSENDLRVASSGGKAIVLAFNVKVDRAARDIAEIMGIEIQSFDIIYKLLEFIEERFVKSVPKEMVAEVKGRARIIRIFSTTKSKQVVGGAVTEGRVEKGVEFRIMRNEHEIGRGEIVELQHMKMPAQMVEAGAQFGAMVESKIPLAERDVIESIVLVER